MALIGEICAPSELIIPIIPIDGALSSNFKMSGALFMSGAKLYFMAGATVKSITSD